MPLTTGFTSRAGIPERVLKFNPHHDAKGRFSSGGKGGKAVPAAAALSGHLPGLLPGREKAYEALSPEGKAKYMFGKLSLANQAAVLTEAKRYHMGHTPPSGVDAPIATTPSGSKQVGPFVPQPSAALTIPKVPPTGKTFGQVLRYAINYGVY